MDERILVGYHVKTKIVKHIEECEDNVKLAEAYNYSKI